MIARRILERGGFGTEGENREKIGLLTGFVSLLMNLLLVVGKLTVGLLSGSVSIIADAVNNIMDSASAVITILGIKLANLPADREHPEGHGRIETMAALVVAVLVAFVGVEFLKVSYGRFRHPEPVDFRLTFFAVLLLSMGLKILQSRLNKQVGEAISSAPLLATAADAMGDVLVTGVVIIGGILSTLTSLPVDGVVGMGVSLFIIYSGIGLMKETLSSLIGEAPSEDFYRDLREAILSYDQVQGVHDMIVNSFGPERTIVVVDVEFPYTMEFHTVHEISDRMERELSARFGISLICHMDAVGDETYEEMRASHLLDTFVKDRRSVHSYHDLSVRGGVLRVDVVVNPDLCKSHQERQLIAEEVQALLRPIHRGEILVDVDIDLGGVA